jgi:radical SAM enzyme (TIGR01210 family)
MSLDSIEKQIIRGTSETRKTYDFNEEHDPASLSQLWFQRSHEGEVLFVVFYSQACRWSRCLGCNLPSKCSQRHVGYHHLMRQIDSVFEREDVRRRGPEIDKIIFSNNGSMLDEVTFSTTALVYLFAKVNLCLPGASVVTLETRPEYVDFAELEVLSRVLNEAAAPTHLELAIGFEAFDDRVRNDVFRKGLGLEALEKLAYEVAPYGYRLKLYFMQKPVPEMSDEDEIEDVRKAIVFLDDLSAASGVKMNMHLNPTYAADGTALAEAFARGEYTPPKLIDVTRAVLHAKNTRLSVFVGLYDEGLAVEGGSFTRSGDEALIERLERFNETQDYSLLESIVGTGGAR